MRAAAEQPIQTSNIDVAGLRGRLIRDGYYSLAQEDGLTWRVSIPAMVRAVSILREHGLPAHALMMYDEPWGACSHASISACACMCALRYPRFHARPRMNLRAVMAAQLKELLAATVAEGHTNCMFFPSEADAQMSTLSTLFLRRTTAVRFKTPETLSPTHFRFSGIGLRSSWTPLSPVPARVGNHIAIDPPGMVQWRSAPMGVCQESKIEIACTLCAELSTQRSPLSTPPATGLPNTRPLGSR